MAHIRKRKLPSGKIRWQVNWHAGQNSPAANGGEGRLRGAAMFDTYLEAKAKLESVQRERPKTTAPLSDLTKHFLKYFEKLVEQKQREASTLRQFKQHINLHILIDKPFGLMKCGAIDFLQKPITPDQLRAIVKDVLAFGGRQKDRQYGTGGRDRSSPDVRRSEDVRIPWSLAVVLRSPGRCR